MALRLTAAQRAKLLLNAVRHSELVRSAKVLPGALAYRRLRHTSVPLLIDVDTKMGMGAILSVVLRLYGWAAAEGIATHVISTSPLYSDGDDVLARYFERPPHDALAGAMQPVPRLTYEWMFRSKAPRHVALAEASALFDRHFTPNAQLRALLDDVGSAKPFDLSIHFRATDKYLETGLVDHEHVLTIAAPHLSRVTRVFLATDDAGFARKIRLRWPAVCFVSYDLGEVAEGKARHFSTLDADDKAREALVNMFLIARAPLCIRTMSYLSSFAKLINPEIRTITVNRRIDADTPFPERQILELEG